MKQLTVGILLFNEVEVLDFAGPFEVFSITSALNSEDKCFKVVTISETDELLSARNGLKVKSDYLLTNHPKLDIVIIPGGKGAEDIEIHNPAVIDWIREQKKCVTVMASVCTGALLLAQAGLLDGRRATTHWMDIERLEQEFPAVEVLHNVKYVDEGDIVTSGGISAGINMSFHLVSRFCGQEIAKQTARRMEYDIEI